MVHTQESYSCLSDSFLFGREGSPVGHDHVNVQKTHILNHKAGLGWTSFSHTGVPVTTSAIGLGAESFNGYYDNTDVAKKIVAAMDFRDKLKLAVNW
jgi:alkaline phosphatase